MSAQIRITKAEYKNSRWYIDIDITEQPKKVDNQR